MVRSGPGRKIVRMARCFSFEGRNWRRMAYETVKSSGHHKIEKITQMQIDFQRLLDLRGSDRDVEVQKRNGPFFRNLLPL